MEITSRGRQAGALPYDYWSAPLVLTFFGGCAMSENEIRDRWGEEHFCRAPREALAGLALCADDLRTLMEIGLPVGPPSALKLRLRLETVNVLHQPEQIRLLTTTEFEIGPNFPKAGHETLDDRLDLSRCIVLGVATNEHKLASLRRQRFVCLDTSDRGIYWIGSTLRNDRTPVSWFNTSLPRYLDCWLAYKEFREAAEDLLGEYECADDAFADNSYRSAIADIHTEFLQRLESTDPESCSAGFWERHAWNEAMLFGVG